MIKIKPLKSKRLGRKEKKFQEELIKGCFNSKALEERVLNINGTKWRNVDKIYLLKICLEEIEKRLILEQTHQRTTPFGVSKYTELKQECLTNISKYQQNLNNRK